MDKFEGAYKSPSHEHGFDLIFEGEIRFGPVYYKIAIDGKVVEDKIFGFEFLWKPNSEYLVLQEWLTTDYRKGPITVLTIIDPIKGLYAQLSKADGGFIVPKKWEGDKLVFIKNYMGKGIEKEFEMDTYDIQNWQTLF